MKGGEELDALIARAQEGDVRAFEMLLAGHLGQVRRFARAFAASEADADDLAQEALLKVYKSLRSFRYQSAFSTWLYTVVRSVCLDFAKSRGGRERSREQALEPHHTRDLAGGVLPDDVLAQEQERRRVWIALRGVPVEFRAALVLFDIEGHSYDEVAAIERVPVGTIKSRLSRGREHLKRLLEEGAARERAAPGGSPAGAPGTQDAATSSHLGRSGS